MTSYVSLELRRYVSSRAKGVCEYCLIHEDDTYLGGQVEHIIAQKHRGMTEPDNLAYACVYCNRAKGSDIGSIAPSTREFTRFFNPRIDTWNVHFKLMGASIVPKTAIGEATATILRFNHPERISERQLLEQLGRYPSEEAKVILNMT
jgi:hypothetical protein